MHNPHALNMQAVFCSQKDGTLSAHTITRDCDAHTGVHGHRDPEDDHIATSRLAQCWPHSHCSGPWAIHRPPTCCHTPKRRPGTYKYPELHESQHHGADWFDSLIILVLVSTHMSVDPAVHHIAIIVCMNMACNNGELGVADNARPTRPCTELLALVALHFSPA